MDGRAKPGHDGGGQSMRELKRLLFRGSLGGRPPTRPEWSGQAGGLAPVQRMKPSSSFFAQAMISLFDWPECTLASIVG